MMLVQHEGGQVVLQVLGPATAEIPRLLAAMRALAADTSGIGSLLGRLFGALRSPASGMGHTTASELAQRLGQQAFRPGMNGTALASLLQKSGLFYESLLARAFGSRTPSGKPHDISGLVGDFKAALLGALSGSPTGPAHEAIKRMLAGLEMEQLTNLARRQAGEGFHWSLPVPDGSGWATVDLVLEREHDREQETEERAETGARLTVGVSFSNLGPIRADLLMDGDDLTVRVVASRGATLAMLASRRDEIVDAFGASGLTVRLSIVPGTEEDVSMQTAAFDVSLLREHHLIDVRG
jgi:hypothetical protein